MPVLSKLLVVWPNHCCCAYPIVQDDFEAGTVNVSAQYITATPSGTDTAATVAGSTNVAAQALTKAPALAVQQVHLHSVPVARGGELQAGLPIAVIELWCRPGNILHQCCCEGPAGSWYGLLHLQACWYASFVMHHHNPHCAITPVWAMCCCLICRRHGGDGECQPIQHRQHADQHHQPYIHNMGKLRLWQWYRHHHVAEPWGNHLLHGQLHIGPSNIRGSCVWKHVNHHYGCICKPDGIIRAG